jgi:hypothetical protein
MTGFDSPSAHHTGERPCASSQNAIAAVLHPRGAASADPSGGVAAVPQGPIWEAGTASKIAPPIKNDVELSAPFINPTSPDLNNLTVALFQEALDGKCGQGPTLLDDDRRIVLLNKIGILFS